MDIVLYHKGCPDGWCSAYIAHKRYPEAELVPYDQGQDPPFELIVDKDVLSVDIRWASRAGVEKAISLAKSFCVIDHHATGGGDLTGLPGYIFDVERSGAGLTWDYLFGKDRPDPISYEGHRVAYVPRPWWVNYIEDRDLWKWRLENSRAISMAMNMFPFTIEAWDEMVRKHRPSSLMYDGQLLLKQDATYIEQIGQYAARGKFRGINVYIVNAPYQFASNLGEMLNQRDPNVPMSITYYERPGEDKVFFSLRGNGNVNVAEVAKGFGGGGHRSAAGFNLSSLNARKLIDMVVAGAK